MNTSVSAGTYETLGWPMSRKDALFLQKMMLKHQPFLHMVDLYLFRNTRKVRKILGKYRRQCAR